MELLQLQYFRVIARTQNISAAAKELHIAQPSLSQLLKRLEREVGTPLFNRVGKHIELNHYGRIFLKYADEVFGSLDNASLEIQSAMDQASRTVRISILAASLLLPEIYRLIRATDPGLLLYILQNDQDHLPRKDELILTSTWDLNDPLPASQILLEEEILLAIPADHPLTGQNSIRRAQLTEVPFLSLSKDASLTRVLEHYYELYHYEPHITCYIDNPDIMRKLLAAQAGFAFIPARTWGQFAGEDVVLRRVEDLPMRRFLLLSWCPDAFLSPAVRLCRQLLIDYFTKYN